MYTQCPECGVAFRVTAEVLKMAAGKVRCGGCGVAFNALAHLSEQKPAAPAQADKAPDPDLPELAPEKPGELEADTPPQTISAEQSAALLKTLDQLAGEDIRIEDTGVEWRVLNKDEDGDEAEPFEQSSDEPSRVIDDMLFDDNTVLPDDFDDVVDAPAATAPSEQPSPEPESAPEPEPPQFDLDLSEPDEWDDLLGDIDEPTEDEDAVPETEIEAAAKPDEDEEGRSEAGENPLDMDTQFAIQAEAMGIDLSGMHEMAEEAGDEAVEDSSETSIEEDLISAAFEAEEVQQAIEAPEEEEEPEQVPEQESDLKIELQVEEEEETEDDVDDIALGFDDTVENDIATLSMSLDEEEEEEEDSIAATGEEHVIPEMSEEEKTINMMIDEELFNVAVEDDDGFASTIVQLQPDDKVADEIDDNKEKPDKKSGKKNKKDKKKEKKEQKKGKDKKQPALEVETIIMEGEAIRGEFEQERLAARKTGDAGSLDSPGISLPLNREKDDYARRREMVSSPSGTGTYVGIAALVLLFVLQAVHQSREALATVPAFSSAVAPVYRMLGRPLTPTWDIGGWRFEATKGDTDENGELLTIYSRIGNNSDEPLPYPLVHLSLTDRFEDVIGSTVLDPGEFLPENADPRKLVPPGNTFNAVISIDSPAENATGFKLNVCYRLANGQLRCADHDFK